MTLARIAIRDYPSVFLNLEAARTAFRRVRGASGVEKNKTAPPEFRRTPQKPGDPFSAIPEGLTHFEDWGAVQLEGPMSVLVISDLHIPYHDKTAVVAALKWGADNSIDTILLNGDISDCFACSFWEKDPRKREFAVELQTVHSFLDTLKNAFPKARIIYKQGNHEERYDRYMRVKAPELLSVAQFDPIEILGLNKLGIEWVAEKRPIRLGKLNTIHGHEHNFAISNPVNPARGFFLRAKTHCLGGHFHQKSEHSEKNLEEKVISTWSTGCLCDLHPDYRPINPWCHGFAFVEVFDKGEFNVRNFKILHGKVY